MVSLNKSETVDNIEIHILILEHFQIEWYYTSSYQDSKMDCTREEAEGSIYF